ncbi:MAG: hypothetical protein QF590_05350 [Dehalococcoidia bacterium]|jgi:hypothetical protein|nr:hypothetical protein [Chloroflexota bacterium]MDP7090705.1 hypothetical protein [Dehalococcoidia bacterium]|tara:strand:+ start:5958 stop:6281 length:324 start_codon:yes stop_codon:yes gene_type:complete
MLRLGKLVPVILLFASVISVAFGVSTVIGGPESVRGQVVAVESASVTTISSLTLQDASGKKWVFQGIGTFSGFTPSHLEEHRALRKAVTVEYEESATGGLTIVGMAD